MKTGLVLGKFMPLHNGHIALIEFALERCDELIILICASETEPIDGHTRFNWISETFKENHRVIPKLFVYNETDLPNTSASSDEVSKIWAVHLVEILPAIEIVFASEAYGAYLAHYLKCAYAIFDEQRNLVPVSSTQIRQSPFKYWDFMPTAVRPYFTKKICILGSESTGKTTLTKRLAEFFNAGYVPEMARDILEKTEECTEEDLVAITILHAETINKEMRKGPKLLFVDTDVNITRSYSQFLFDKELVVPAWIEAANKFDLYLYLDIDAPFVQDGTRLEPDQRELLHKSHQLELSRRGINYELIRGNWEERFLTAVDIVIKLIEMNK